MPQKWAWIASTGAVIAPSCFLCAWSSAEATSASAKVNPAPTPPSRLTMSRRCMRVSLAWLERSLSFPRAWNLPRQFLRHCAAPRVTARWPKEQLFRKQLRGEIPFAQVRQNDHDELALVLRPLGHLQGGPAGGAGGNAAHQALVAGQLASQVRRILVLDLDHFVDHLQVQDVGNKPGADALDGVLARLQRLARQALGDDGAVGWLYGNHFHTGPAGFEHFAAASDRAAGAHAADHDVYGAGGVAPDLLGRGLTMD